MFSIQKRNQSIIKGESCSDKQSSGMGVDYFIEFDNGDVTVNVRYNRWQTGERDITCLEAIGDPRLNTVIGRMRLCIEQYNANLDKTTLKTAIIKRESPAHANLFKRDLEFYRDALEIALIDELKRFGECKIDTKEVLLNEIRRTKNELCMLYPSGNEILPVAAFTLTRIVPIIISDKSLYL